MTLIIVEYTAIEDGYFWDLETRRVYHERSHMKWRTLSHLAEGVSYARSNNTSNSEAVMREDQLIM